MANTPFTPKALYDFLASFEAGMDGGTSPLLLPKNQMAYAENITVRGNFASTRPAFWKRTLTFNGGIQAAFEGGRFQGCCYLKPVPIGGNSTLDSLIVAIGGKIYRISIGGNTFSVDDISPSPANPSTDDIMWMWQTENYVIIQDGISQPIIYDSSRLTTFRSNPGSPGTIVPAQKVAIIAATQPVFVNGVMSSVTTDHVVYPPIGQSCIVNLKTLYAGDYNIDLDNFWLPAPIGGVQGPATQFGQFTIQRYTGPTSPPPVAVANAKLTNVGDTPGVTTTLTAGSQVLTQQTTSQLVQFATVTSWTKGVAQYTLHLSAVCPYGSIQVLGSFYAVAGGDIGTNHVTINQAANLDFTNAPVYAYQTSTVIISLGTLQPPGGTPYTSPAVGADVAVELSQTYNGTDGVAVTVNGIAYTIKKFISNPGGSPPVSFPNLVVLVNKNQNPIGDGGFPHWFYNEPRGTPPADSDSSYLMTPASTTPGTASTGIPVGRMGCYGMGRNWISLSDGSSYWASDLVGGPTGTQANNYRDAVLQSKDNTYLAGGGLWVVPSAGERITAMIFTALLDTSLGQGPQAIMTPKQVFTNQAPLDRTTWINLGNPLQTVGLISNGALGHYSTIAVNGDTIFRSIDGIRSYILARRDFDVWGNVPISHEVSNVLDVDDVSLLEHGSAIVFQNRMFMTANPLRDSGVSHVYHPKLIVLNFDPLSTLRGKEASVYDGVWTGMNVLQMVKGDFAGTERAFAFVFNTTTSKIELHELMPDNAVFADENTTAIVSDLRSGSMKFGQNEPQQRDYLRLIEGEIIVADLKGPTTFSAYYRPDQYTTWTLWRTFTVTPTDTNDQCFRPRLGLGEPNPSDTDSVNNRPMREAYTFDFRLVASGYYTFVGARFKAISIPQTEFAQPT